MAAIKGEKTFEVDVPLEHMYDVVVDYARYPEFISDVAETRVDQRRGEVAVVSFVLPLARRIGYTVRNVHQRPLRIDWDLVKGTMMKKNSGSWTFAPLGDDRTRVTYVCELDLGMLVPRKVTEALVKVSMPKMLNEFKARAEALYKG